MNYCSRELFRNVSNTITVDTMKNCSTRTSTYRDVEISTIVFDSGYLSWFNRQDIIWKVYGSQLF